MVLLSVYHGKPGSPLPGGPQIRVLPLVGSEPLRWPTFTVSPLDPRVYLAAAAPLVVVITAGLLIPARRATTVDPLTALRSE